MLITFDATPLRPDIRYSGVGNFIDNIISRLEGAFSFEGLSVAFDGAEHTRIKTFPRIPIPTLTGLLYEISPILCRARGDVFWGTSYVLPWLCSDRSVLTVHHNLLRLKGSNEAFRFMSYRFVKSLRRARKIVTDSRTTADDLVNDLPELARKIEVVPLGINHSPTSAKANKPYVLPFESPYAVMLGAYVPRKNLPLALAAVARLSESSRLRLVLTRDLHPDFDKIVSDNSSIIHRTGTVSSKAVRSLLEGAVALLFPSSYEGFGFPILEAMSAGCPVVALNTPINREIVGKGGFLLEPDPKQWAATIEELMTSARTRDALRAAGWENIKRFSWDSTAKRYGEAFTEVAM